MTKAIESLSAADKQSVLNALSVSHYNLKPSNTQKFRSGMARRDRDCLIACVGPSTTAGQQTPVVGTCFTDSWPARLAALLNAQGIPAGANGFWGDKAGWGVTQTMANYTAGDSRVALSAGSPTIGGVATQGGNNFALPVGAAITFTPQATVSKYDIWWRDNSAAGGKTFTASAGTSGTVTVASAAAQVPQKTTINCGSSALHVLTLTSTVGTCEILGVRGYDDTNSRREISILNWGISGAISSRFNSNANTQGGPLAMITTVAPDCAILGDLPINDWRNSVSLATSKAAITSAVQSFKTVGDVILTTPLWDNGVAGLSSTQDTYAAMLFQVAVEQDVPLLDTRAAWVSYAAANALGWYSSGDNVHPSALGYNVEAIAMAQMLRRVMSL